MTTQQDQDEKEALNQFMKRADPAKFGDHQRAAESFVAGYRAADSRWQGKCGEGFEGWYLGANNSKIKNSEGIHIFYLNDLESTWQAARAPLIAQLAAKDVEIKDERGMRSLYFSRDYEQRTKTIPELNARIAELERAGFHMSALQCVHPEALTVREGQDGVSCAKRERIERLNTELTTLRSELEKERANTASGVRPVFVSDPGLTAFVAQSLFDKIAHGDDEHRRWLAAALGEFYGVTIPTHPSQKEGE